MTCDFPDLRDRSRQVIATSATRYYVIAGLAFTNAVTKLNELSSSTTATASAHIGLFVLFASVAIRFVHGASTHFGLHKTSQALDGSGVFEKLQPLFDFVGFGVQASLFVVLSSNLHAGDNFLFWLFVLFGFDWLWILATLIFDQHVKRGEIAFRTLCQWIGNDVVLGGGLAAIWWFATWTLDHKEKAVAALGLLVFAVDYLWNHRYYFGEVRKKT